MREYQDEKCDIIMKYTTEEARNLKAYGELPDNCKINETTLTNEEELECAFDFDEVDVDDI